MKSDLQKMKSVYLKHPLSKKWEHLDTLTRLKDWLTKKKKKKGTNFDFKIELEQREKRSLQTGRKSEMIWAFSMQLTWSNVLAKSNL